MCTLFTIYISLSKYNPFRGCLVSCGIHTLFVSTPWLAACHNVCVLCVFVVSTVFSIISAMAVESYFSVTAFLFIQTTKRWVVAVEMTCYYFLSTALVLIAVISLILLIMKHRRAIAIQLEQLRSASAPNRNDQLATHLPESDHNRKVVSTSANQTCSYSNQNN